MKTVTPLDYAAPFADPLDPTLVERWLSGEDLESLEVAPQCWEETLNAIYADQEASFLASYEDGPDYDYDA